MQNEVENEESSITTIDNSSGDEFEIKNKKRINKKQPKVIKKIKSITNQVNIPKRQKNPKKDITLMELPTVYTLDLQLPEIEGSYTTTTLFNCTNPIDYFMALLDDEVMESIRHTTSKELHGALGINTITTQDIYRMIGMLFVLDIYPFTDIEEAFSKRDTLYKSDFITSNYTLEEFRKLHNNLKMPDKDPMILFRMVERAASINCKPSNFISLDEMLRKFMGKYKYKHRIISKPAKEGIKYFVLCCSSLKVPLQFTFHDNQLERNGLLSKTANMVDKMVEGMIVSHRYDATKLHLFTDNYFNSHELFKHLLNKRITCIGTFKSNMIPKEVREAAATWLKQNSTRIVSNNVIYCPTKLIECEGIYYLYIVDNGTFCLATNSIELIKTKV